MMAFADLASYSQQRGTAKKKPRGKKGVCFAEPSTGRPRPDVGLLILLRIINNPKNMKMMMFKNRQQLHDLLELFETSYKPLIEQRCRETPGAAEGHKLEWVWWVFIRLAFITLQGKA